LSLWNGVPNVMTEQTSAADEGRRLLPAECSELRVAASLSAAMRSPLKSSTSQLIARWCFIVSVSVRITVPKIVVSSVRVRSLRLRLPRDDHAAATAAAAAAAAADDFPLDE